MLPVGGDGEQRARLGSGHDLGGTCIHLVERDTLLAGLDETLQAAIQGCGSLAFLAGEAGIGKTTAVQAFVERHDEVETLVGACDNLSTPPPLGPMHDMAQRSREVAALLERPTRHELFVGFLALLATPGRPMIVVLEDVHWADEATLDLLRFVGRRVAGTRAMVLATYRSDEVGSSHPLREVLGDLATGPAVSRRALTPLSVDAVATLARDAAIDPHELHRRTGGNPFYVTEVLADPEAALPDTLRDAVLARAGRLGESARAVLDVASLVPSAIERELLDAVLSPAPADVDECVRAGMLHARSDETLAFRHELARLAVADAVLPARRASVHSQIAEALLALPNPPSARITHHAAAAGDGETVLRHAPQAAANARERGAYAQATEQLARALDFSGRLNDGERVELLEDYAATALYTTGVGGEEIDEAVELRRTLGDDRRLGRALALQARHRYGDGRSREAYACSAEALRVLEPVGESPELLDALTTAALMAMLARRYEESSDFATRTIELAQRLDRPSALASALNTLGAVELLTEQIEVGTEHTLRSHRIAAGAGMDIEATRALLNLGSGAGEVRRYELAEQYLWASIKDATERDLDDYRGYAQAWLGRVHFETGRWAEAAEDLAALPLEDPALSTITRITGFAVLGRLRVRRGDPDAEEALRPGWDLATTTDDLQRLWPVAAARAEAAVLADRPDDVPVIVERSFELAAGLGHPWALGDLGLLLWRAGELGGQDRVVFDRGAAEPYRLHVQGDTEAAAEAWADIGCPYERADALSDGAVDQQLLALEVFDELGASPAAARLRHRLRTRGVRSIPRGPRPATAAHPHGLTARQAEVLELVDEGLTNAEIAEALFISPKTVGHHVSAAIAKLGANDRHEAARLAHGR